MRQWRVPDRHRAVERLKHPRPVGGLSTSRSRASHSAPPPRARHRGRLAVPRRTPHLPIHILRAAVGREAVLNRAMRPTGEVDLAGVELGPNAGAGAAGGAGVVGGEFHRGCARCDAQ